MGGWRCNLGGGMVARSSDKDSYTALRPSKSERNLSRINISSPDPAFSIGGGGDNVLTPGEIAAAIGLNSPRLPLLAPYVSHNDARRMLDRLLWYKYANDGKAGDELYYRLLCDVFVRQLNSELTAEQVKDELKECDETMQKCTFFAIDDVCRPAVYMHVSEREWARKVGLGNHMAWRRRWQRRYHNLRLVVQEMDDVIWSQASKRV